MKTACRVMSFVCMVALTQQAGARLPRGGIGRWLGLLVGVCMGVIGCGDHRTSGPTVSPREFESLTLYAHNPLRKPVPEASLLATLPHVQVGPRRTQRLFADCKYHWFRLGGARPAFIGGAYLGVGRTADGRECALLIGMYSSFFVIQGQREFYSVEGSAGVEWERVLRLANWRAFQKAVFEPLSRNPQESGLRLVKVGGKFGYVNSAGSIAIEARFDDAMPFSEGLAAVRLGDPDDGKWGYIDTAGRFVIEPRFAGASFFSEGLAAVTVDDFFDGKQGYIDRQGKIVIEPRFTLAWPFVDGLAVVGLAYGPDANCRCVNRKGEFVKRRYPDSY